MCNPATRPTEEYSYHEFSNGCVRGSLTSMAWTQGKYCIDGEFNSDFFNYGGAFSQDPDQVAQACRSAGGACVSRTQYPDGYNSYSCLNMTGDITMYDMQRPTGAVYSAIVF